MSYDPGHQPPPGHYPPPPMPYGPPPRPKKRGLSPWAIVGIVVGALVLVCGGGGLLLLAVGAKAVGDNQTRANGDVKIAQCHVSDIHSPEAIVDIHNSGSRAASYTVTVAFSTTDGSRQLDTAMAVVNDLAPGQTAQEKATSLAMDSVTGDFRCRITDVSRL